MSEPNQIPAPSRRGRTGLVAAAVVIGLAIGLAGVYGIGAFKRNGNPACRATAALAQKIKPLVHGEVAAINVPDTPLYVPNLTFHDGDGNAKQLSDWRGRTILLNLWATWCVPCREEMPALDALQGKLGSPKFQVVAVNIDTRDPNKPKSWLKQIGVDKLGYFADPSAKVFQDLKAVGRAFGMPTSMLIDTNGCELGTIAGPAQWASDDAVKLIEAAMARP